MTLAANIALHSAAESIQAYRPLRETEKERERESTAGMAMNIHYERGKVASNWQRVVMLLV